MTTKKTRTKTDKNLEYKRQANIEARRDNPFITKGWLLYPYA
jgi:hypothetical protein